LPVRYQRDFTKLAPGLGPCASKYGWAPVSGVIPTNISDMVSHRTSRRERCEPRMDYAHDQDAATTQMSSPVRTPVPCRHLCAPIATAAAVDVSFSILGGEAAVSSPRRPVSAKKCMMLLVTSILRTLLLVLCTSAHTCLQRAIATGVQQEAAVAKREQTVSN
jgi:hypothetical protein